MAHKIVRQLFKVGETILVLIFSVKSLKFLQNPAKITTVTRHADDDFWRRRIIIIVVVEEDFNRFNNFIKLINE